MAISCVSSFDISDLIVGDHNPHVHLVEVLVLLHAQQKQVFQLVKLFSIAFHEGLVEMLDGLALSQLGLELV